MTDIMIGLLGAFVALAVLAALLPEELIDADDEDPEAILLDTGVHDDER